MPLKDPEARKEYHRAYQAEHYASNKEYYKKKRKERYKRVRDKVQSYKLERGCKNCGENHIACLDFHHRDQSEKEEFIYKLMKKGCGWPRLYEEINKCDVLCSNCHRKLHYEQAIDKRI